jgi:hypothetical protein
MTLNRVRLKCHIGNATNDLCFLLFSSSTPGFRKENWDWTLQNYYDCFVATLRSLDVTERQLSVSYRRVFALCKKQVHVDTFLRAQIHGRIKKGKVDGYPSSALPCAA